ncbi:hypothetical protein CRENBAI_000300 [Crenichthys baileyi]|uniref:Uncharacterized protein n=1 Tax=Crenichthys baileyi TaxID=28760 RepID=A0AAV9RC73_9TELE
MELADSRQESARDRWVRQEMKEAMKCLPTDLEVVPSPLLLEEMELAPASPGSGRGAVDLFAFLSREAERTLRHSAGLSVPQSAYDGSGLAIPCPGTGPLRRRSLPAPMAAHSGPAVKPSPSSRRKKRRRGAPSCSAGEEIKTFRRTSLIYSSPELMERIRQMEGDYETAVRQFYCRPPSPTPSHKSAAAAQPTSDLQRAAAAQPMSCLQSGAAAEQSTPGLQSAVERSEGGLPPFPGPEHLLSFLWGVLTELKPDTHHDTPQSDTPHPDTPQPVSARSDTPQPDTPQPVSARPDTPQPVSARPDTPQPVSARPDTPQPVSARPDTPQPVSARPDTPQPDSGSDLKSASTSSTRRRGRRKRDASAPAHATEGLGDASAPAHATEGFCDASAPSLQGFSGKLVLVLASEPCDEGYEEEEPPDPVSGDFKGQFVLVLASEPLDEEFKEEAPPDPVSGDFKEQFVLVLASEPRGEGLPGSASASEGLPGSASASEGLPGSASASEGLPGSASASEGLPGSASASEGLPGIPGRPPELCACSGRPPGRPPELCACSGRPPGRPPELCACSGRPPGRPPELCACSGRPLGRPPELCACFWPSSHGPLRPPCLGFFLFGLLWASGIRP